MAVGEDKLPVLQPVPGIRLGTASAGIKKPGRKDLVLIELVPGSTCAGVLPAMPFAQRR